MFNGEIIAAAWIYSGIFIKENSFILHLDVTAFYIAILHNRGHGDVH